MGKFVNPKKIKGQDQLNRIKDLMGKMNTLTESKSFAELELIKRGPNGVVYGILRENHNYFIKTTEKKKGTFLSEDFNYVGGIQNKYDERYKSYAEALKHLNLKFDMLNESFGVKKGNNIFESDGVPTATASGGIKSGGMGFAMGNPEDDHPDQNCWEAHEKNNKDHDEWMTEQNEELTNPTLDVKEPDGKEKEIIDEEGEVEEQKKVIKVDAPAPAPVEDEVTDEFATAEVDEFGGEEEFEAEEEFGDEEEGDDYTKKIQKLTGKVSQMIRDKDEPDGELDKYVINSVVSAIDWEEISDEDVEDIIAKIEGEDEEDGEGEFDGGEEVDFESEETIEEPVEEITEETQGADKWEAGQKFKDSYLKGLSQKQLDKLATKIERLQSEKDEEEVGDEDTEERVKHEKEAVKDDKKIEADAKKDAKEAKKEKEKDEKEEKNESKTFSKKQLMETFLKKNTNLALKKVLNEKYAICEECLGGGCAACDGGDEESIDIVDIASQPENIDAWTPLYEYDDAEMLAGDDINVREQEMDVTTALATGQDYLEATGDLDRDGDKIPNRLDLDNNDDGRLDRGMDDDFIEIDIDSIMGNAPVKEPDVAPPTTTPGIKPRKPRWREITRPNVDPRPKGERKKPSSRRRGIYR